MASPRRLRLAASGGVLLALVGVWLGHTLEFARVAGLDRAGTVVGGSLHLYMAPVGGLLALLAACGAVRGVRLWRGLGRQLDAVRGAVFAAWRGRAAEAAVRALPDRGLAGSAVRQAGALWLPLTLAQMALYLLQENLEAYVAGYAMPGVGAVSGVHALAPLVHALVALVLSVAVVAARRLLRRRAAAVESVVALLRRLLDRLGAFHADRPATSAAALAPLARFGRLWCRPPPALLSV